MSATAHGYHCAPTSTPTTLKENARSETSLAKPPTSGGRVVGNVANPPSGGLLLSGAPPYPHAYVYLNCEAIWINYVLTFYSTLPASISDATPQLGRWPRGCPHGSKAGDTTTPLTCQSGNEPHHWEGNPVACPHWDEG